jgi:hypothetical protein
MTPGGDYKSAVTQLLVWEITSIELDCTVDAQAPTLQGSALVDESSQVFWVLEVSNHALHCFSILRL